MKTSFNAGDFGTEQGDEAGGAEQAQYLSFKLGEETYAMDILSAREILEFGPLTEVPMMPAFVRGVINLRGRVVPVVDLAVRFGRQPTRAERRSCIVIVDLPGETGAQDIGVIVDAVYQVIEIAPADLEAAPSYGGRLRHDFISAMGKLDGRFVTILDMSRVLAVGELASLGQVMREEVHEPRAA